MFEYHGWLSSLENLAEDEIRAALKRLNGDYPSSVQYVNGSLHVSFSGNPNRLEFPMWSEARVGKCSMMYA